MNDQQIQELREHLSNVVHETVNGKIDKLHRKLDDYIADDTEWKVRAEPVVKAFENTSWMWRAFIGTLKFLGIVSVGIGGWKVLSDLFHK